MLFFICTKFNQIIAYQIKCRCLKIDKGFKEHLFNSIIIVYTIEGFSHLNIRHRRIPTLIDLKMLTHTIGTEYLSIDVH